MALERKSLIARRKRLLDITILKTL
jgi:hypothetical protein